MYNTKSLRIGMVFALLVVLASFFIEPSISYATTANNTSFADCMKNPDLEGCQDSTSPAAETEKNGSAAVGLSIWDYVKTLFALVFVVGLLYALLKFMNKRNLKYQQNQIVQNLGGLSLGAQKSVQLLQVGDALFLVGVGEDIQLLKEITDREQIEKLMAVYNDRQEFAAASPYIAELLGKLKNKSTSLKDKSTTEETVFSEVLGKKLSDMKEQRSKELEKWKQKENDKS